MRGLTPSTGSDSEETPGSVDCSHERDYSRFRSAAKEGGILPSAVMLNKLWLGYCRREVNVLGLSTSF